MLHVASSATAQLTVPQQFKDDGLVHPKPSTPQAKKRAAHITADLRELQKQEAQIAEARKLVNDLPQDCDQASAKKRLRIADDLLSCAATAMDNLRLDDTLRQKRRELLREIEKIDEDSRKQQAVDRR